MDFYMTQTTEITLYALRSNDARYLASLESGLIISNLIEILIYVSNGALF